MSEAVPQSPDIPAAGNLTNPIVSQATGQEGKPPVRKNVLKKTVDYNSTIVKYLEVGVIA